MRRSLVGILFLVAAAGVWAQQERAASRPLGPGSRLENVRYEIVHEGVRIPPFTVSYVLPAGRTAIAPDGRRMYSATLDPARIRHGELTVDLVPTINVKTDPGGRQTVQMAVTYNNRSYGTPKSNFRTSIRVTVGGEEQFFSSNLYTSCMDGATLIRMHDGSEVPIRDLTPGEYVWNPVTGEAMEIAEIIRGPEPFPLYRIPTAQGSALFSAEHPMPTAAGFRRAADLAAGDRLVVPGGSYAGVTRVEAVPPTEGQMVYNLRFSRHSDRAEDHLFLAGGLVVGDYWLQDRLRDGTAKR